MSQLPERIEMTIPLVEEMVNQRLILVTDVDVIKYGSKQFYTENA